MRILKFFTGENLKSITEKAIKYLGGLKFSFVLLILLVVLISERAIIAQKIVTSPDNQTIPWFINIMNLLGLDSPKDLDYPFLIVLLVFVLNLTLASTRMVQKIRSKQRTQWQFKDDDSIRRLRNYAEFKVPSPSVQKINSYLKEYGFVRYKKNEGKKTSIYAIKHRFGQWGVFLFHLTFVVVLVGALLSWLTRFTGYTELTPGKMFIERQESYLRATEKPLFFSEDRYFSFQLEEIDLAYWKPGVVKNRAAEVSLFDRFGTFLGKKRIEVNSPLRVDGIKIYQGSQHGFLAGLEVVDSKGTKATGEIHFKIPGEKKTSMQTSVRLPGTSLRLSFELFTDRIGSIEGLEELALHHDATMMKVFSREGDRERFLGVVFGGGTIDFEGLTLRFVSLAPYTSFFMVQDYGVPVIFTGFVFLLFGLLVTYFWVPEMYWVNISHKQGKDIIIIGAVTDKFKESFSERFNLNMAILKKELEKV